MSDELNKAQGIKKVDYKAIADFWYNGDDTFFKPENKESLIKSLRVYLDYCEKNGTKKCGTYNGQIFSVSNEKDLKVSFYEDPVVSWLVFSRAPKKIISIDNSGIMYKMEYSMERDVPATIWKLKNGTGENILLKRIVAISNEGIGEYCRYNSTGAEELDAQINDYLVRTNPKYVKVENGEKTRINEIYRQNILKDEFINEHVLVDGELCDGIQIYVESKNDKKTTLPSSYRFFEDEANKRIADCKEIYSMISLAYKKELQSEISDERQDKIKRVKDLINISKQQDEEISVLERKIQKEGE